MEKLNKLVSLLLVMSFLLPSVPVMAQDASSDDEEISTPQNPPGAPPGVQCTELDQKPATGGVCCVGLELNNAGKCDEPTYSDSSLVTCTTDENCSGGTACLPQTGSDLFSSASPNPEDKDALTEARNSVLAQLREVEGQKENGGTCSHSKDCGSYSCVAGVCKEKLVCRYAKEGEVAAGSVKCAGDLVKGFGGKCELSPEAKNMVFVGLLDEAKIIPDNSPTQLQCRFTLDQETKDRSLIAMRSLRAMEWFFSTISLNQSEECFQVMPVLKQEIGSTFLNTRKTILSNFSEILKGIEGDYRTLIAAKTADPKEMVTIHNTEQISYGDLYSRQTSGVDSLMMLYRRNILFQNYEEAMLKTVEAANSRLTSLSDNMGNWTSGATSWNVAGRVVNSYNCDGSKYKVKKFLKWKTKYYNQVRDRWSNYYEVSGNSQLNSDVVKRPQVAKALSVMTGKTEEEAVTEYTKNKFYLIDPMMFSTLKSGNYGEGKPLKKKSSFLGLFGGFKDLRKAYYIRGDAKGSFTKMYSDLRPGLESFYSNLKPSPQAGGKPVTDFVYEPELLTTEAKDCLDNPKNPAACAPFTTFLDGVQDEAFAHFLAYSYHTQDSYDGFFENATSYRRKLLAKLQVDMQNISKYYQKVIETRNLQNTCIEALAKGLEKHEILATEPNINEGLIEGPSGPSKVGSTLTGINKPGSSSALPTSKIPRFDPKRFNYDLVSNTIKDINTGTLNDRITSGSVGGSGSINSSSIQSALAMRESAMKKANAKAKSSGVNIDKKEKAVSDVMRSMRNSGLAGGGSMLGSNSSGNGGSNFDTTLVNRATVSKDEVKESSVSTTDVKNTTTNSTAAVNPFAGVASGSMSGGDSGSGTEGQSSQTEKDHSGLSDADKDRLMSAYEENKSAYEGTEEDGIFKKVSKAYVRNLEKVLTKKKKID